MQFLHVCEARKAPSSANFQIFIIALFAFACPIIFHCLNPCSGITTSIPEFQTIISIYSITAFVAICCSWLYIDLTCFCNLTHANNHILLFVATFFTLGAMLGFYDLYLYTTSLYALLGCLICWFANYFFFIGAFLEKHLRSCPKYLELRPSGSSSKPYCYYFLVICTTK